MQWFHFIVTIALLQCSNAATIIRPETSEISNPEKSNSVLPWNNLFSFVSYFASSTPSYDPSSNEDYYQDDCEEKSASSETIIIYDVDEQVLPPKNATNGTNSTVRPSRHKRDAEETRELSPTSEGRHKEVRPYPGYFLGRKLWYVPLWFGVYYSFYLLCLVVKSVARHRISYPALLPADTTFERKRSRQKNRKTDSTARRISDSIGTYSNRYRPYQ